MKLLFFSWLLFFSAACHHRTPASAATKAAPASTACYKGRLAIKGICINYVIEVLDGNMTALQVEKSWKDETDGKEYNNVFTLGSRCTFPDLKEGETFYFTLAATEDAGCNVCMAYRPVPAAKNNIVVSQTPCN